MRKAVIAAIAVVVVAGGSAMAYSAYARHDGWGHGRAHFGRMSPDDRAAYADARIAALKAGLRLSAEQEKLWPPVEATLKDLAAKRLQRQEERRAQRAERRERREEWRRGSRNRSDQPWISLHRVSRYACCSRTVRIALRISPCFIRSAHTSSGPPSAPSRLIFACPSPNTWT